MSESDIAKLAAGLTAAQKKALLWLSDEPKPWPKGSEVSLYVMKDLRKGNPEVEVATIASLCRINGKSLPGKNRLWGQSLWQITPLGKAVQAYLSAMTASP